VLPVFVREGKKLRRAVGSMPGVNQTSVDEMLLELKWPRRPALGNHPLGVPENKDATGSSAGTTTERFRTRFER